MEDLDQGKQASMNALSGDSSAEQVAGAFKVLFRQQDANGSGDLDPDELSALFKQMHTLSGRCRPRKALLREVQEAMQRFDRDGSGALDLMEEP